MKLICAKCHIAHNRNAAVLRNKISKEIEGVVCYKCARKMVNKK